MKFEERLSKYESNENCRSKSHISTSEHYYGSEEKKIQLIIYLSRETINVANNRGDICLRCTKITLAHESFCYFFIFCFFVVRHAKTLKFSIVIHWFLRVKENFWLDVID